MLVRVLKVGIDATDKEINEAKYGAAPPGYDFLVLGHESFGVVEEVGANVTHVRPGDYVAATVRRPGKSIYDQIGTSDMTSEEVYYERGINLLHGFLTEHYVDDAEFIVKVPVGLEALARAGRADECRGQGDPAGLRSAAPSEGLAATGRLRARRRTDWAADDADPAAAWAGSVHAGPHAGRRRSMPRSCAAWTRRTSALPKHRWKSWPSASARPI